MLLNNLNKLTFSVIIFLSSTVAIASEQHSYHKEKDTFQNHYFITLKSGLISPTTLGGNSGLNVGNTTYTTGLAIGKKFLERFSAEIEYMYRGKNSAKSNVTGAVPENSNNYWDFSSNTFMANLSANLTDNSFVTPYVKGGLGYSINKASDYTYNYVSINAYNGLISYNNKKYTGSTTKKFAWQLGAGLNLNTSEKFDTQIQYVYIDRGEVKTQPNYISSINNTFTDNAARTGRLKEHVVTFGITFKF